LSSAGSDWVHLGIQARAVQRTQIALLPKIRFDNSVTAVPRIWDTHIHRSIRPRYSARTDGTTLIACAGDAGSTKANRASQPSGGSNSAAGVALSHGPRVTCTGLEPGVPAHHAHHASCEKDCYARCHPEEALDAMPDIVFHHGPRRWYLLFDA
jgi:hypothetical protein